jgi:hypothetical protein
MRLDVEEIRECADLLVVALTNDGEAHVFGGELFPRASIQIFLMVQSGLPPFEATTLVKLEAAAAIVRSRCPLHAARAGCRRDRRHRRNDPA